MTREIVEVEVALIRETYKGTRYFLVLRCSYCGQRHQHGAGRITENPSDFASERLSHCARGARFYKLVWRGAVVDG